MATVVGWGLAADDVSSVVGELAANAIRHARSRFEVALSSHGDVVVVELSDASRELPFLARPGPHSIDGRGLLIVEHLARTWGSHPRPEGGKVVWAEVPVTPHRPQHGGNW